MLAFASRIDFSIIWVKIASNCLATAGSALLPSSLRACARS